MIYEVLYIKNIRKSVLVGVGGGGILFATKLDNSALSHDKHYSLGEIYKEMRKNLKPKGLFFFFFKFLTPNPELVRIC